MWDYTPASCVEMFKPHCQKEAYSVISNWKEQRTIHLNK